MNTVENKLQKIVSSYINHKTIKGVSVSVEYNGFQFDYADGNLQHQQPYFIASSTKLMTIALILQLVDQRKIALTDSIWKYLDKREYPLSINYKGADYSNVITIEHCLKHSSGIPDYFLMKEKSSQSVFELLQQSNDRYWTSKEKMMISSQLPAPFKPDFKKSHYSDTNFTILGLILEQVYQLPYHQIVDLQIVQPLSLKKTYIYTDPTDQNPIPVGFKTGIMMIPKAMASFGANGGAVSISEELNCFLKAFWNNYFFKRETLLQNQSYNRLFYPLKMGLGIQTFQLPGIFTAFKKVPLMMGHAGINGTMAFAMPEDGFYFSGTVNNAAKPNLIFQLAVRTYLTMKNK